ncbi:MAG: hypothetical protein CME65_03350 [Halobacteriovoraceae bacterium]|nr:hypothetical protein [Halobacteriovoraceae bacterium]|tara:strand:- start:1092 stop:2216 length:1125 start_codon:yes stop_codon:yes gene_type:complete
MEKLTWKDLIQLSMSELRQASMLDQFETDSENQYSKAIVYYLEENLLELKELSPSDQEIKFLIDFRIMMLERDYSDDDIKDWLEEGETISEEKQAELYFLAAYAAAEIQSYVYSKELYQKAYPRLKKIGADKKAIKSLLNLVVSEQCNIDSKKLILDYNFVATEARKAGDPIVEGLCFLNMSYEHQKLGGLELALNFVNQALDLLQNDFGANHYYSALAHRCHVLIELGRYNEALFDFQKIKVSRASESLEALKVIQVLLGEKQMEVKMEHLEHTWRERLFLSKKGKKAKKLTKTENDLLQILSTGPKSKAELIESLYGEKIDFFAAESRLKMLLSRFRKKCPGVVSIENSLYQIVDDNFLIQSHEILDQLQQA